MRVSFYADPLIDPDHRIVRSGFEPAADSYLFFTDLNIVPPFQDEMSVEVKRRPFADRSKNHPAPNYAVFDEENGFTGKYFVTVEAVTPSTVRLRLRVDWWGTYGDILNVTGAPSRGASGFYGVPARFDQDVHNVFYRHMGTTQWGPNDPTSSRYVVVVVFQCYKNNNWPASDDQPFQATFISRTAFTVNDIKNGNNELQRIMGAKYFVNGQPDGHGSWDTKYDIISVFRRQLIPYDMIHGSGTDDFFDVNAAGTWSGITSSDAFVDGYAAGRIVRGENPFSTDIVTYSRNYPISIFPTDPSTENSDAFRLFIGNEHNLIPLDDIYYDGEDRSRTLATLRISLTLNEGILVELLGDRVVDLSAIFDIGTVTNADQEMKYQAGDTKVLGQISAGIGAAAQFGVGIGSLATGNPMGLVNVAGGFMTAATSIENSQYRGRQNVTNGGSTAWADASRGVLFVILVVEVANREERHADRFLRGLIPCNPQTAICRALSLLDPGEPGAQAFAFTAPAVRVTPTDQTTLPLLGGYAIPGPSPELLAQAAADLERGIMVVSPTLTDLSSVY